MKLRYVIYMYKTCFVYRVTQKNSDILWSMIGNGKKRYFQLCLMIFFFVLYEILMHFGIHIQFKDIIQGYSKVIEFCPLLGIIFGN